MYTTPVLTSTTTYYAQPTASDVGNTIIGTGASISNSTYPGYTGQSPFAYHYGNYKHQMLIKASELAAAGLQPGVISSLSFVVVKPASGTTYATLKNFKISLKNTTSTSMTNIFESGTTLVWSGNYKPTTGVNTFSFTTSFNWDGFSNLIVQTCYNNNDTGNMNQSAEVEVDNTSFVAHTINRADGTQPSICADTIANNLNDGPTISNRPKMIFNYMPSCTGARTPVVATVSEPFDINLGADTTICTTEPLILNAYQPGGTYAWSTGANTPSISVASAGIYIVSVTYDGCTKSDTIEVGEIPAPIAGTIVVEGSMPSYDFSTQGASGVAEYHWDFGDGNTATGPTPSHTYAANGQYTVTLEAKNECGQINITTAEISVNVGVESLNAIKQAITVFPNPTRGLTTIDGNGNIIHTIDIIDQLGRVVLKVQPNAERITIDVNDLAQGVYILKMQTSDGQNMMRLAKSNK